MNTLERWTRPSCYVGATWEEYFQSGVGQSRDSGCLERANFDAMREALQAIPTPENWPHEDSCWQVVCENHWAVGWVEWIAIHQDATAHLEEASRQCARLENYPVLDEDRLSRYENEEADQVWRDCYRANERVEYIRKHRGQFEFHDFQDMIRCVRGKYFAGYASELISR